MKATRKNTYKRIADKNDVSNILSKHRGNKMQCARLLLLLCIRCTCLYRSRYIEPIYNPHTDVFPYTTKITFLTFGQMFTRVQNSRISHRTDHFPDDDDAHLAHTAPLSLKVKVTDWFPNNEVNTQAHTHELRVSLREG